MIKAIIFDFDGVIHDTFSIVYGINKILHPELSEDEYKSYFDGNIFEKKQITSQENDYFKLQKGKYEKLVINKQIKEELIKLKEKFNLFVVSSNKEEAINGYFENNQMNSFFSEVLGLETDTSKERKFELLFNKYNLKNNECVFVTDTLGDLIEAKKTNISSIAVDFGFHDREKLQMGGPFRIVSNFSEIPETIEAIGSQIGKD